MTTHNYYVYILASKSGTLYTGFTNDLLRRTGEHKQGHSGSFTTKYGCTKLVYYEHFLDAEEAIRREKFIKGKVRKFKEGLIRSMNPGWKDLFEEILKRDSSLRSE